MQCAADPAWLEHLRIHLWELTAYLDTNTDALPNYEARYRAGQPISTGFAESAVNQILATRMIKRRQMRWNRTPSSRSLPCAWRC